MNEENSLEEVIGEVENLRERLNIQSAYLGFLSIVVFFLLAQSFINDPFGPFYLLVIVMIIIPMILVICRLEQRGL